jgi:CRP/FNR family transcriptional regulator
MIESEAILQLPPFTSLSPATRQAIAHRTFRQGIPEGRTFVLEGLPAEFGYFLLSGQARVLRMSEDGRLQVLGRFGRGAPLNIISLLGDDRVNRASIEALTPLAVLVFRAEDFHHLLNHHLDFSNSLLQVFAQRMTGMTDLAASLSLYSVRARLAQFLIELAGLPETAGGWTQDEIAAQIGTVRDVVGRLLRDFESQGFIRRDRQHITLLDRNGLEAVAAQQEP